jgi:hypothetical protein
VKVRHGRKTIFLVFFLAYAKKLVDVNKQWHNVHFNKKSLKCKLKLNTRDDRAKKSMITYFSVK